MSVLSWGKPRLIVQNLDDSTHALQELATPVQDSTQLNPTQGSKTEAKIEGGANEDVRLDRATYELVYNIRAAKGRSKPFDDDDGTVNDNYLIAVVPEDPTAVGLLIPKSSISMMPSWTAADGAIWQYTQNAVASDNMKQIYMGSFAITESEGTITKIVFTPVKVEGKTQESAITINAGSTL